MPRLRELLREVEVLSVDGSLDLDVAEVRDDSRAVQAGDLFVAQHGGHVDGHDFLAEAHARGAVAVVVERAVPDAATLFPGTRVLVAAPSAALARIAANRHGDPARTMRMVAVTGTNGKTTTTFLIESILRAGGCRPGVIGTVSYRHSGKTLPAPFTTPTPLELHAVLAEMKAGGCTDVVMEASSHALALERLAGIRFRIGAFTNLTQDHLDFHGTMDSYFHAKARLFRHLLQPSDGVGVIFLDGGYGRMMANSVVGERLLVSLTRDGADLYPLRQACTIDGIDAELSSPLGPIRVRSRLIGSYNLANIAVAAGVAVALGLSAATIEKGITSLAGVPGRVERVEHPHGFAVTVDYAHTHDALENVLAALRPLTRGRLICVFGCGGDRDRTKRPLMGRVVARDADLAIVTSDNPRTEEPGSIIDMIVAGVRDPGPAAIEDKIELVLGGDHGAGPPLLDAASLATARRGYHVQVDRRAAIDAAIAAARPGDVVLIAGKGHEDYQILGKTKHPFDDRVVAAEALARWRGEGG